MGQLLLVRHGQASWDAADYDVLSPTGHEQSRVLGAALAARGVAPDLVVTGGMRRHRETCEGIAAGYVEQGGSLPEAQLDAGWAEFDHVAMLGRVPAPFEGRAPSAAEFQAWFEDATDRWTAGRHDEDYAEPFSAFAGRVAGALARTAEQVGSGTALVVTSGGPIAWATTALLTGETDLWRRLNPVCANSGITKVVTGRRGQTLVTFNEHVHLEGRRDLLTYR